MAQKFRINFKSKSLADYSKAMKENMNNPDALKRLSEEMEKNVQLENLVSDYKKQAETLRTKKSEIKELIKRLADLEKKCIDAGIGKYEDTKSGK